MTISNRNRQRSLAEAGAQSRDVQQRRSIAASRAAAYLMMGSTSPANPGLSADVANYWMLDPDGRFDALVLFCVAEIAVRTRATDDPANDPAFQRRYNDVRTTIQQFAGDPMVK